MINVTWSQLKQAINNNNLSFIWAQDDNSYTIAAFNGPSEIQTILPINTPSSADQIDFETNYKNKGNGLVNLTTKDTVNDSVIYSSITVGTTSVEAKVGNSKLSNRKILLLTPLTGTIYFGGDNSVTTTNGTPILKGQTFSLPFGNSSVWIISEIANNDVRIVEGA